MTDREGCWRGNSHGNMYPWHKKKLIYSIISFVSGFFFRTFRQLRQFRLFPYGRFVLFFSMQCKRDCFDGKSKIWSLSASRCRAGDHNLAGVVLITWRSFLLKTHDDFLFQGMLFRLISIASVLKKYKHMCVLKNKREIQNYEKLRVIGLFCYTRVFRCNMRVFLISYKHFIHVGMLQSRYKQCKVEWLLSTWSDYVPCFASSLFAISTTFKNTDSKKGGEMRVKIPRDRLTMCRWIKKSYYCILILINGSHSIPVLPKSGQRWGL